MSFSQPKKDKEIEESLVREFQGGNLKAYDKIAESDNLGVTIIS